jgi:hypothetical protein
MIRTLPQLAADAHGKTALVKAALERGTTSDGVQRARTLVAEAIADLEALQAALPLAYARLRKEENRPNVERLRANLRATDIRAERRAG